MGANWGQRIVSGSLSCDGVLGMACVRVYVCMCRKQENTRGTEFDGITMAECAVDVYVCMYVCMYVHTPGYTSN